MPGMPGIGTGAHPPRRSGPRVPGTSSTRGGRSRSSTRCWCCSRPLRSAWRRTGRSRPRWSRPPSWRWCCRASPSPLRGRVLLWVAALAVRAAARALARAGAPRGRAGRLRALHGGRVGVGLLPPPHGRAVDERPALLAPRPDELRPHERERPRAGAEAPHRAERGDAAGGGADGGLARARGRRGGDRGGTRRGRGAPVREAPAGVSGIGASRRDRAAPSARGAST